MPRLMCVTILLTGSAAVPIAREPAEEPAYRVQTEVTVTGTVSRVFFHTGQRGTSRSRATITTAGGSTMDVHLGPTSFVREKSMELLVGDTVTVTGSQSPARMLIVMQLIRGGKTLDLRNAAGRALLEDRHR